VWIWGNIETLQMCELDVLQAGIRSIRFLAEQNQSIWRLRSQKGLCRSPKILFHTKFLRWLCWVPLYLKKVRVSPCIKSKYLLQGETKSDVIPLMMFLLFPVFKTHQPPMVLAPYEITFYLDPTGFSLRDASFTSEQGG
jgi:hypothetical protein